jgi:hypothetical protein
LTFWRNRSNLRLAISILATATDVKSQVFCAGVLPNFPESAAGKPRQAKDSVATQWKRERDKK